jgi:predicted transcriptional regulator
MLLGWSQHDLAEKAGVSYPTVARLEASDGDLGGRVTTAQRIVAALAGAGIEFISDGSESASGGNGVRLQKPLS